MDLIRCDCNFGALLPQVTVLQKYIRGKIVREQRIMPSALEAVYGCIPEFTKMSHVGKKIFSLMTARALLRLSLDPELHGKEIYFDKKIELQKGISLAHSFYIRIDNGLNKAIISVNVPKKDPVNVLGIGKFKIVVLGYELHIPLTNDRLIKGLKIARVLPKDPLRAQEDLLDSNRIHQEVFDLCKAAELPVHMTEPSRVREHVKNGKSKWELIQTYYPTDLNKLHKVKYEDHLSHIITLFETIDFFSSIGVTHRDIKADNILVGEELHSYVHDFDMAIQSVLGTAHKFSCWDTGGQMGLITHATDFVGGVLMVAELLFYCPGGFYRDYEHAFFKAGLLFAIQELILPKINEKLQGARQPMIRSPLDVVDSLGRLVQRVALESPERVFLQTLLAETKANLKILEEICEVLKKEEPWAEYLRGSCICYFEGLTKEKYETLRRIFPGEVMNEYYPNIDKWIKEELIRLIPDVVYQNNGVSFEDDTRGAILILYDLYTTDRKKLEPMTVYELLRFGQLMGRWGSLHELVKTPLPKKGDPKLFSLLHSRDPQERKEGRDMAFTLFPRANVLKEKIQLIREEYLAEISSK